MPLTLIPPRKGRWANWRVRGTHLGTYVDRSTGVRERTIARQIRDRWQREIERGEFERPAPAAEPTFGSAALAYMQFGGEIRPLKRLISHFKDTPLSQIDQAAIDAAAAALYPGEKVSPATRNREVYTPVSAVLKHAKVDFLVRRPKGAEGEVVTAWLWPEQAFAILEHAETIDAEFSILLAFLLYTGVRLSEALRLQCDDVRIEENFAYVGRTKNGDPRAVHLPAALVEILAKHPRKLDRKLARVFRFAKGGNLYWLLRSTCMRACGLEPPKRVKRGKRPPPPSYELDWVNFHTFCHSWATWMRRYGKLDTRGLVGTGRWKSEKSAERYNHVVVTEESRRAELLPRPMRVGPEIRAKSVRNDPSSA